MIAEEISLGSLSYSQHSMSLKFLRGQGILKTKSYYFQQIDPLKISRLVNDKMEKLKFKFTS